MNYINKLSLFVVALFMVACASSPTYVAPGNREVPPKAEPPVEQVRAPQVNVEAKPVEHALKDAEIAEQLRACKEELHIEKQPSVFDNVPSVDDEANMQKQGMRAMYEAFKDNLVAQCIYIGCRFKLPDFEQLQRMAEYELRQASHD